MSLPYFPEDALGITCEQAFNMLLGSIAMEELALSHIMNAEGEKLQYVIGTLSNQPRCCATPKDILEVNRSVSELLEKVAYNQILLKGKLQQVLEARASQCPPAPERPLTPVCDIWVAEKGQTLSRGCALPWKKGTANRQDACWQGCSPCVLHLCPQHTYLVSFVFRLRTDETGPVQLALQKKCDQAFEDFLLCETCITDNHTVFISGCTVLAPNGFPSIPKSFQFTLKSPGCVLVEQAILNLIDMR